MAAGKSYKQHGRPRLSRFARSWRCIAPVAMLFIPCRGGVSHRPDEYASPEWIGGGVHVLARTLGARSRRSACAFKVPPRRCMLCLNPYGDRGFPNHDTHAKTRIVGASVPRKEGVDKLLGRARYVDDIEREGMWYGATVRSTIPRGLIRSIAFDRRIDWSEFTVVTAADIPGENHIQLIVADQPCLADGKVNHCEEPILLLAHPDKHKLREAVSAVHDRIRSAAAGLHHRRERAAGTVVWGADNLLQKFPARKRRCRFRMGAARRTSSKANTAPARRNISTSRTTA